jgi:hypothetical protein
MIVQEGRHEAGEAHERAPYLVILVPLVVKIPPCAKNTNGAESRSAARPHGDVVGLRVESARLECQRSWGETVSAVFIRSPAALGAFPAPEAHDTPYPFPPSANTGKPDGVDDA